MVIKMIKGMEMLFFLIFFSALRYVVYKLDCLVKKSKSNHKGRINIRAKTTKPSGFN